MMNNSSQQPIISMGASFKQVPMMEYAKNYLNTVKNAEAGINSSVGILEDLALYKKDSVKASLKKFFIEETVDPSLKQFMSSEEVNSTIQAYEQLFENDYKAITESSGFASYAPVVGLSLPIHKNLMMNTVWGNVIENRVATVPTFTVSMEHRFLVTPDGREIDLALEQNKVAEALDETVKKKKSRLEVAKVSETDFLTELGGTSKDRLSTDTFITAVCIPGVVFENGDVDINAQGFLDETMPRISSGETQKEVWFKLKEPVTLAPAFGADYQMIGYRNFSTEVKLKVTGSTKKVNISEAINLYMKRDNTLAVTTGGHITKVEIATRLDASTATLELCSVKWRPHTESISIPTGVPINTTVSPDELKDIQAFYNVDQTAKIMSIYKDAMSEHKDKTIKNFIDESWTMLPETSKVAATFDFWLPSGSAIAMTPVEYRHIMFAEFLDSMATRMIQVLNDPNVVLNVVGDPDTIRRVTPTQRVYESPANIGPISLDYTQTIVNVSHRRVTQLFGSDKMRNSDQFIMILNPRGTERFIYRLFEYQLYVGNEVRNPSAPANMAIHAYDRFAVKSYQPVQGRISIQNRTKFF